MNVVILAAGDTAPTDSNEIADGLDRVFVTPPSNNLAGNAAAASFLSILVDRVGNLGFVVPRQPIGCRVARLGIKTNQAASTQHSVFGSGPVKRFA